MCSLSHTPQRFSKFSTFRTLLLIVHVASKHIIRNCPLSFSTRLTRRILVFIAQFSYKIPLALARQRQASATHFLPLPLFCMLLLLRDRLATTRARRAVNRLSGLVLLRDFFRRSCLPQSTALCLAIAGHSALRHLTKTTHRHSSHLAPGRLTTHYGDPDGHRFDHHLNYYLYLMCSWLKTNVLTSDVHLFRNGISPTAVMTY